MTIVEFKYKFQSTIIVRIIWLYLIMMVVGDTTLIVLPNVIFFQ